MERSRRRKQSKCNPTTDCNIEDIHDYQVNVELLEEQVKNDPLSESIER